LAQGTFFVAQDLVPFGAVWFFLAYCTMGGAQACGRDLGCCGDDRTDEIHSYKASGTGISSMPGMSLDQSPLEATSAAVPMVAAAHPTTRVEPMEAIQPVEAVQPVEPPPAQPASAVSSRGTVLHTAGLPADLRNSDPQVEAARAEDAWQLAERDGGLVLGFRLADGSERSLPFGSRRPPLGMDFTKTEPVTVKRVRKGSPAEELGVEVGWQVYCVNANCMEGRSAADVFLTMKAVVDAAFEQDQRGQSS